MGQRSDIRNRPRMAEELDNTPVHIPGGPQQEPLTLREEMQRFIRQELSKQIAAKGDLESFEDADDFEEDDPEADLLTPYNVIPLKPEEGEPADDLEGIPQEKEGHSIPDDLPGQQVVEPRGAVAESKESTGQ